MALLQRFILRVPHAGDLVAVDQHIAALLLFQERGQVDLKSLPFPIKDHNAPTVRSGRGEKQTMLG